MTPRIIARLALGPAFLLAIAGSQAAGQDDALKKLLEKLEPQAPATGEKKVEGKPADGKKAGEKKSIASEKDKTVDSLLEKLGGGRDEAPTAKGKAPGELGPEPGLPGMVKPIDAQDEGLDEHLERLLGRIKKDKDEQEGEGEGGQGQSPEGGRLAETVKKMRDVEQRLTKLDTGAETRKTQDQIVGDLDQLLQNIQKMRQQRQEQQGKQQGAKMAGQAQGQGDQAGNDPGERGGGSAPQTPKAPDPSTGLAGAKDSWGHLPGTLREVMENVSRMQPLPEKKELVERYFLSVAKRSLSRSGGE